MSTRFDANPWYRERWPWILMAGPAVVVVAGAITIALAIASFDGLVADDYYKRGLGINRALARDDAARAQALVAAIRFNDARDRVQVVIAAAHPAPHLTLAFVGARPADDRTMTLPRVAAGVYEGNVALPRGGKWRLQLGDGAGTWRLAGKWDASQASVTLRPAPG